MNNPGKGWGAKHNQLIGIKMIHKGDRSETRPLVWNCIVPRKSEDVSQPWVRLFHELRSNTKGAVEKTHKTKNNIHFYDELKNSVACNALLDTELG